MILYNVSKYLPQQDMCLLKCKRSTNITFITLAIFAFYFISIFIIDCSVNGQIVRDTITTDDNPSGIDVNIKTNKIYVANTGSNSVTVVDGETNQAIDTIAVGNRPFGVAVNETTNFIYVTNMDDDSVSVINGETNLVTGTITVGDEPWEICVNPVTNRIYVINSKDDSLSLIDGSLNETINTIPVGSEPIGLGIDTVNNIIYVSNKADNTISVIDGQEMKVIDSIQVSGTPFGIDVNTVTNLIYVAIASKDVVAVINGLDNKIIDSIPVGDVPYGVSVNSKTNHVYVTNHHNDTVSIVDSSVTFSLDLDPVVNTVVVGNSPFGIKVNLDSNLVYVTNEGTDDITVILVENIPLPVPQPTCFDIARFNADTKSGTLPLIVQFNDESGGFLDKELTWEFGDGTKSNMKNPLHAYSEVGIYTVSLSVVPCASGFGFSSFAKDIGPYVTINSCCGSSKIKPNFINVFSEERTVSLIPEIIPPPSADFTAMPISGAVPLKVQFKDTSEGDSDSWLWEFGDGNISRIKNPMHEYINEGIFTVGFSISGPGGGDVITKEDLVSVAFDNIEAPTPMPTPTPLQPIMNEIHLGPEAGNGIDPVAITVNTTTNSLYIANEFSNNVSIVDRLTSEVVNVIEVGDSPADIKINPTTNFIYVANSGSNNVSVIDGKTNQIIETILVGNSPRGIGINPVTNRVYVVNQESNDISIIDGTNNTFIETINVGSKPFDISVNSRTNRLYVANLEDSNLNVIDGSSNEIIAIIEIEATIKGIVINETTNQIYVTSCCQFNMNPNTGLVIVVDGFSNEIITNVSIGCSRSPELTSECFSEIFDIRINETTNQIYVSSIDQYFLSLRDFEFVGFLSVIDGLSFEVTANIEIRDDPR